MQRHRNFFASALVLLALPLTSVRASDDAPHIELQYWTDPNSIRAMAEIFERYEQEHPGIKVVVGQSAARNMVEDPQRVLCAIVGGNPPDIIVFDRFAVGEWAARGAFMPLDDFVATEPAA